MGTTKIVWSGPHLDGKLVLSVDEELQNIIFFQMDADFGDVGVAGTVNLKNGMTPQEQIDVAIEEINKFYLTAVVIDAECCLREGRILA
jgi:hypothetical protein